MFENTLLIIKPDYMNKRKGLLQHLLSKGFFIQGNRKLAFTPEDAAEFYKELVDDNCFMLFVILLSKGTSEAFILTKMNAAEELLYTMICFFGDSVEMDRNVHVSRDVVAARREIIFIFPNYIHEPIEYFDSYQFSKQPIMGPLIGEVYSIVKKSSTDQEDNWRVQLSDWLQKSNSEFPQISNQCSQSSKIGVQEKCQQTEMAMINEVNKDTMMKAPIQSSSTVTGATSDLFSSSSCVSCSGFRSGDPCPSKTQLDEFEKRIQVRGVKTLMEPTTTIEQPQPICEEHIEWVNVYECEEAGVSDNDDKVKPMTEEKVIGVTKLDQTIREVVTSILEEKPCEPESVVVVEHPEIEEDLKIAETRSGEVEEDIKEGESIEVALPTEDFVAEAEPEAVVGSQIGAEEKKEVVPEGTTEAVVENAAEVVPDPEPETVAVPVMEEQVVTAEEGATEEVPIEGNPSGDKAD